MTPFEEKMLRRFVVTQVERLRARGQDRRTTREAFRAIMGAGMLALNKTAGHTELGAHAFRRGAEELMPAALRMFDEAWPEN